MVKRLFMGKPVYNLEIVLQENNSLIKDALFLSNPNFLYEYVEAIDIAKRLICIPNIVTDKGYLIPNKHKKKIKSVKGYLNIDEGSNLFGLFALDKILKGKCKKDENIPIIHFHMENGMAEYLIVKNSYLYMADSQDIREIFRKKIHMDQYDLRQLKRNLAYYHA